tara:strand:- start:992 stop:1189 length:198 start_codon:yes stop_codon:yes gene_type:complete
MDFFCCFKKQVDQPNSKIDSEKIEESSSKSPIVITNKEKDLQFRVNMIKNEALIERLENYNGYIN